MTARRKTKAVARIISRPEAHCAPGVCNPRRHQGLRAPAAKGTHQLISLTGPGVFLGALVTKQGGGPGLTALALVLGVSDGALQAAIAVLAGLGGYKIAQATGATTHD